MEEMDLLFEQELEEMLASLGQEEVDENSIDINKYNNQKEDGDKTAQNSYSQYDIVWLEKQYGINLLTLSNQHLEKLKSSDVGDELGLIVGFVEELWEKYRILKDKISYEESEALEENKKNYKQICDNLEAEKDKKINECLNQYSKKVAIVEDKRRKINREYEKVSSEQTTRLHGIVHQLSQTMNTVFSQKLQDQKLRVEQLIQEQKQIYQENIRAIDLEKQATEQERDNGKKKISLTYIDDCQREKTIYETIKYEIQQKFSKNLTESIKYTLYVAIFNYFESENFGSGIKKLMEVRSLYHQYNVPKELPEYYYICDVAYDFGEDYRILINAIKENSQNVRSSKIFDEKGTITLPMLQTRAKGMKVCTTLNACKKEDWTREFVLRQFMSFPVGKLEAVFIAPLTNANFSVFTKLAGDDYKRVIDTKIWTDATEIESALKRARERMDTIINHYGNANRDVEQREERENFRLICIADFPSKFTVNALKELETIVKKGPAYGVSVALFYDETERVDAEAEAIPIIKNILNEMNRIYKGDDDCYLIVNSNVTESKKLELRCLIEGVKEYPVAEKIINEIASHMGDYKKRVVKGEEIYQDKDDINLWLIKSSKEGIVIPLGTQGKGDVVNLTLGRRGNDIRHHVLVEGSTGAGKSVFLHTLICSTIRLYPPSEVQLILLDYKESVEFKIYADYELPSFRVVSVQSEREYGLKVLDKLVDEMVERYNTFKRVLTNVGEPDIEGYRNATNAIMPRILLIIDEFERLIIENDDLTQRCMRNIEILVKQGRAAGIHVILSTQHFSLPHATMENMAVRFALQGSSNILQAGNTGVEQLKDGPEGQVVFNDNKGVASNNKIFQIAHLKQEKADMLYKLSLIEQDEFYRQGIPYETQILHTSIEGNRKHVINQFVMQGIMPGSPLAKTESTYPMMLGNSFELDETLSINLRVKKGSNLLIASEREKNARNLFDLALISILFADLCNSKTDSRRQSIFYIDFGATDKRNRAEITQYLKYELCTQIASVDIDDSDDDELDETVELARDMIDTVYRKICDIKNSGYSGEERCFFLIFGINRSHILDNVLLGDEDMSFAICESETNEPKLTYMDKIKYIYVNGPACGVNTVMWTDNYEITRHLFGEKADENIKNYFDQKVVSFMSDADTKSLVFENTSRNLGDMGALFLGRQTSSRKFRIYDALSMDFLNQFVEVYKKTIL